MVVQDRGIFFVIIIAFIFYWIVKVTVCRDHVLSTKVIIHEALFSGSACVYNSMMPARRRGAHHPPKQAPRTPCTHIR
jgi:hypothetical protein